MQFKVDHEIVEAAAKAPKAFVDASLGIGEGYTREPGIQLTKKEIKDLRRYETLGLSLPIRYNDVVVYLDYGAGDGGSRGLTPDDFLKTFRNTYDHASKWYSLRSAIKLTGTQLKVFSGSIILIGESIVELYEDHKATRYLEENDIKTWEDYQRLKLEIPNLPDLELSSGEVKDIKFYLKGLKERVQVCHKTAGSVKNRLDSFGSELRMTILPQIKLRLQAVSDNTYANDINDLQKEMDSRSLEIDELNARYDKAVQEAIEKAAGLTIGGLIFAIYGGVKAEEIRKERNKLRDEQVIANQKMGSKNKTLESLNRVRLELQNLSSVTAAAGTATENLQQVWNSLIEYIDASNEEVDKLESAISLKTFITQIKVIVDPWSHIQKGSDELLNLFTEADKEYEKENLMLARRVAMISAFKTTQMSKFSMVDLRALNEKVQVESINAQALLEQYDYLPDVVGRMKSVADSILGATFDLRTLAQKTSFGLERSARKLKIYQDELGSPDETDEIHQVMEDELLNAFNQLSAQSAVLNKVKTDISTRFDRGESAMWVVMLEKDRMFAEERKAQVEEKILTLQKQLNSVSDAIDTIEKAGIEKIGKETELTLENLQALGMAPPQIQIALLAIDTAKKLISGIGEFVSYLNMFAAYNRLREMAGELKKQSASHTKTIAQVDGRIKLVKALNDLDDNRWGYAAEFDKLIADFGRFVQGFQQDKSLSVELRVSLALAGIPQFVNYLSAIRRL